MPQCRNTFIVALLSFSFYLSINGQSNYLAEIQKYQKELTSTYSDPEKSILGETQRQVFVELGGHPFFEINPDYRVDATFEVYENPETIQVPTSSEVIKDFLVYGKATFTLNGKKRSLTLLRNVKMMSHPSYKDYLFLAYKDLNSGDLCYCGGRYIDIRIPEDKTKIVIDFNKSYHPYCAYTDGYNCPIPPVENFLDTYIDAGIQLINFDELSAEELIHRSINFHDPEKKWDNLIATMEFQTIMADSSERERTVTINNYNQSFKFNGRYDGGALEYGVENNAGIALWNGKEDIPDFAVEKYRVSPDRAVMYRNYYTYLYGMPMKLLDPGSIIHPQVERVRFYEEVYDKVKVTYDPTVGTDTWYFYFDPETHALEAYQFFKDESKNDGEYILFEEILDIQGVKIPRIRHWYYNKDDKFLASDILLRAN